jgi:hypothetical protein
MPPPHHRRYHEIQHAADTVWRRGTLQLQSSRPLSLDGVPKKTGTSPRPCFSSGGENGGQIGVQSNAHPRARVYIHSRDGCSSPLHFPVPLRCLHEPHAQSQPRAISSLSPHAVIISPSAPTANSRQSAQLLHKGSSKEKGHQGV